MANPYHFAGYQAVKEFWEQDIAARKKKKYVKRISMGPNTWLCKHLRGVFKIVYYDTPILTYKPDGSIELDYGEHKTRTTKSRMNRFLPKGFKVFQRMDIWYVYFSWQFEAMLAQGQGIQQVKKDTNNLWKLTKEFSSGGKCLISSQEMLFYSLGKVEGGSLML